MVTPRSGRPIPVVGALLLALALAPGVSAQNANEAFPALAGGGPPDWVQPGLRLSWYGEAASIRSSAYTYVEDENGEWEDPITHKRYRRTEEDELPTAAGRAFTQTDVIALDGDHVILDTTMLSIDIETGQLAIVPLWGGRYDAAAVDGAWVRADLLAGVDTGVTRELRVLRGPYDLGGTPVDAVAFMHLGEGTYASAVFDAASGLEVASTSRAKGAGSPVHGPLDQPEGNVLVAWARFVNQRTRALPGQGEGLPDWVAPGRVLDYAGTLTVTNPFDPSGFEASWPVTVSVSVERTGVDWATWSSRTSVDYDGYVETANGTGAHGSAGQYWVPPDALAGLTDGERLDADPVTGAELTVVDAGPASVTLRTEMPGVTVTGTYDVPSGALVELVLEQGVAVTRLALTGIA